jgi:hypothetical protein
VVQENEEMTSFSYLDPDKRLRVSDNTLKLIQKQALLDYYERHSTTTSTTVTKTKASGINSNNNANQQLFEQHPDSGFYSPTETTSPWTTPKSSAQVGFVQGFLESVINGSDHPEQSSVELNGPQQLLLEVGDQFLLYILKKSYLFVHHHVAWIIDNQH